MCRLGVPLPASRAKRHTRMMVRTSLAALCAAGLLVAIAWTLSGFIALPGQGADKRALAALAKSLTDALRTGELDQAIALTIDDETSRRQLEQSAENNPGTVQAGAKEKPLKPQTTCQEFLTALRDRLAAEGLAWDRVHPVAFGGLVASVTANDSKARDKAKSVLGEVYFESDGAVYALELTARRCGRQYVVVDFWRCTRTPVAPDGLEKYSLGRFQTLGQEPDAGNVPVRVKDLQSVFAKVAQ